MSLYSEQIELAHEQAAASFNGDALQSLSHSKASHSADPNQTTLIDQSRELHLTYFECILPKHDGACSAHCPCDNPGSRIPRNDGYLYITKELVDARRDARSLDAVHSKTVRMEQIIGTMSIISASDVFMPALMCKEGALRRGLDLAVAAKDAHHWWKTGLAPLRSTPCLPLDPASDQPAATRSAGMERDVFDAHRPAGAVPIKDPYFFKECPSCAERIRLRAHKCRFCCHEFSEEDIAAAITEHRAQQHLIKYRARSRSAQTKGKALLAFGAALSAGGLIAVLSTLVDSITTWNEMVARSGLGITLTALIIILSIMALPFCLGIKFLRKARRLIYDHDITPPA